MTIRIAAPSDAEAVAAISMGFKPLGTYCKVGFKHGSWRDVGWWQKELQLPPDEPLEPARFAADRTL